MSRTTCPFKSNSMKDSADQTTGVNVQLEWVRESLAQVIVVNGLRDLQLQRELMAKHDSDWDKIVQDLQCRGTAEESVQKVKFLRQPPVQILDCCVTISKQISTYSNNFSQNLVECNTCCVTLLSLKKKVQWLVSC